MDFAKKKILMLLYLIIINQKLNYHLHIQLLIPNRFDDRSELNYLCAAGVCFMFLVALNKRLRDQNWF